MMKYRELLIALKSRINQVVNRIFDCILVCNMEEGI